MKRGFDTMARRQCLLRRSWFAVAVMPLASALVGCGGVHQAKFYDEQKPMVEAKRQRDKIIESLGESDNDDMKGRLKKKLEEGASRVAAATAAAAKDPANNPAVAPVVVYDDKHTHHLATPMGELDVKPPARRTPKPSYDDILKNPDCRKNGCFVDMDVDRLAAAAELVHGADSPLHAWNSWRYLSGVFEENGKRRITVVILDDENGGS